MKLIDLLAQKFGHWTVLGYAGHAQWLCRCDRCDRERVVDGGNLRRGGSKSCGCVPARLTHGHCRNGRVTRAYGIWAAMLQRCYNPNNHAYANYGGRGIGVCERWHTFTNLLADMGEPPPGRTIDRRNNDGNYEPTNCWWATYSEQARNRRRPQRKLRIKLNDPKILAGLKQLNAGLARMGARP